MEWNQDPEMGSSTFYSFEAEQVVNIPLSNRFPEDKFIWHFTKDGRYSEKCLPFGLAPSQVVPINGSSESVFGDQMWNGA